MVGVTGLALLHEGMRIFAHIEHVIASEKIECHFTRCGRFRGAMRPEHYETMARDSEELRNKLVELKAVEPGYPLYGTLRLEPNRPPAELLAPTGAACTATQPTDAPPHPSPLPRGRGPGRG